MQLYGICRNAIQPINNVNDSKQVDMHIKMTILHTWLLEMRREPVSWRAVLSFMDDAQP